MELCTLKKVDVIRIHCPFKGNIIIINNMLICLFCEREKYSLTPGISLYSHSHAEVYLSYVDVYKNREFGNFVLSYMKDTSKFSVRSVDDKLIRHLYVNVTWEMGSSMILQENKK